MRLQSLSITHCCSSRFHKIHYPEGDIYQTLVLQVKGKWRREGGISSSATNPNFFFLLLSLITSAKNLKSLFLQAFEQVISMFTTMQSGIWVGLLVKTVQEPG